MGEGSQKPWFAVTFSQKTESLPLVKRLLPHLHRLGIEADRIFLQDNISDVDQESHWLSQWMGAQRASKVAVCLLTSAYLRSRPCCTEWKLILEWQRLVICTEDPEDMMLDVELNGFNGPPLAHLQAEEQTLSISKYSEEQLAMKIYEKYLANRDRSYEEEMRSRGAARRLSMTLVNPSAAPTGHSPLNRSISPPAAACSPAATSGSISSYPNLSSSRPNSNASSPSTSPSGSPPSSPPRPSPALSGNNPSALPMPASEMSLASGPSTSPSTVGRHIIITPAVKPSGILNKPPKLGSITKAPTLLPILENKPQQTSTESKNNLVHTRAPSIERAGSNSSVGKRVSLTIDRSGVDERLSQSTFPAISPRAAAPAPPPPPTKRGSNTLDADSDLLPSAQGFMSPPVLPSYFPPSPMCPPSLPQISPPPAPRVSVRPSPSDDDDDDEEDGNATSLMLLSPFVSRMSSSHSPSHGAFN